MESSALQRWWPAWEAVPWPWLLAHALLRELTLTPSCGAAVPSHAGNVFTDPG